MNEYVKIIDFFNNLYDRWQDEHEHEDFKDYIKVFKQQLPVRVTDFGMTSDPFYASFMLDGHWHWLRASAFGVRYNEPIATSRRRK